jgi:DNA-directed RNA polymerase subunit M/transcription elongation factor TFIIS
MSKPVYYVQECPTCGRSLQIRVAHLGKQVVCQHCLAEFMASDPANKYSSSDASQNLLARAEELLATVEQQQEAKADWAAAEGV